MTGNLNQDNNDLKKYAIIGLILWSLFITYLILK